MHGSLQHLSLQLSTPVSSEALIALLHEVGHPLQTLSLRSFSEADDSVLTAIKASCNNLHKLRLTDNATFTDAGLAHLFTGWTNPPLSYIDFTSVRDIDNNNADGPADCPIGVASAAFEAMMHHSGARLEYVNVSSCRHISHETLTTVFSGEIQYPELKEIDVSFVGAVDTLVLAGLFKAAPKLRRVVAFGCFAIEDLVVPAGMVVIGVPKAQDAIEKVGGEVDVEEALAGMAALMEQIHGDWDFSGSRMQVDVKA
jgi:DNA repair protein RAD7